MSSSKDQAELLNDISEKLDTVIAFLAVRDVKDANASVEKLADMGFGAKTISSVSGITKNAVSMRLTRMRKKSARRKE